MMPNDPVTGGNVLRRPAIQSPDYVSGVSGWTINSDGTAEFNSVDVRGTLYGLAWILNSDGFFIYAGTPGGGNLIGSWAASAGTDQYNNDYPAGLSVLQGLITGIGIDSTEITNSTFQGDVLNDSTISSPAISGGTMTETAITFDSSGGVLYVYSSSTTTITQSANGSYTWTVPSDVTVARVQCWAADAGGTGGSSSAGGRGGGGGEYAEEPAFTVTPGNTYSYNVGNGGTGGSPGNQGQDGGDTNFNPGTGNSVWAHGGNGNGTGGTGAGNTIHHDGGAGGTATGTGGGGGGGRAGSTGAGGNGANNTGSGSASGGSAGSGDGGHSGGSGGANTASGGNGGGGGGAGATSTTQNFDKTYKSDQFMTYYGSDATGSPNAQRGNYPLYQGGETASGGSYNGTQKSIYGYPDMRSDLSGVTISAVTLTLTNLHSWYNSGMTVLVYSTTQSGIPTTYNNANDSSYTFVKSFSIGEGAEKSVSMPVSLGNAFKNGTAFGLVLGPGSAYDLNNYGYFKQAQTLRIQGTSGSNSPTYGGNGQDGQVKITYTSGRTMVAAVSPVSGSDSSSNAFGAGFTGQIQAFKPGVTPTVVETWHNVTPPSGWSGTLRYKLMENNSVRVHAQLSNASGASGTISLFTLPSAYTPANGGRFPVGIYSAGNPTARLSIGSNGLVEILGAPSTTEIDFCQDCPMD